MDNEALYKFHKKMANKAFKALHKADTLEVKDAAAQSACRHTQAAWRCLDDAARITLGNEFLDAINAAQGDYEREEKHPVEIVVESNPYRLRMFAGGVEISGVVEADVGCSSDNTVREATIKLYGVKMSTLEEAQGRNNSPSNS